MQYELAIMQVVTYTGSRQNICPISLAEVSAIEHPVAFFDALDQPYEYDMLVEWLVVHGGADPKTRTHRSVQDLVVLHISDENATRKAIEYIQQHTSLAIFQVI